MEARIKPVEKNDVREDIKSLYDQMEKSFGTVPNLFKTIAHKPDALLALVPFTNNLISDSSISQKIKEVAILATSKINKCDYCVAHHTEMGKKAGLTQEQIDAIDDFKGTTLLNDEEKAVVEYSEMVTRDAEDIPDSVFQELKKYYSDEQIVLLTLIIGLFQIFNKFNGALGVQLEHV